MLLLGCFLVGRAHRPQVIGKAGQILGHSIDVRVCQCVRERHERGDTRGVERHGMRTGMHAEKGKSNPLKWSGGHVTCASPGKRRARHQIPPDKQYRMLIRLIGN